MRITVPGRELKSAFKDISGLLKKYEQARVVGVSTTKTEITFTVDAGTYYTRTIEFIGVSDVIEVSLTVLFVDLSHFIHGRTDAVLELTDTYIRVTSRGAVLTLNIGESIVAPYQPRGGKPVELNYGILKEVAAIFTRTQDLQKAFSRDFAIAFYGNRALLKSPTMWIETKSQGLECVLSIDQLKSILMFLPERVEVSDRLEFRKGKAILSIPKITPTEQNHMATHLSGMSVVSGVDPAGILKELVEIKRVVGACDVIVRFFEEGFSMRVEKGGISLEKEYGVSGKGVLYFRYPLDLFTMCLNLLGESDAIIVHSKEGLVCLRNTVTSILLSVLN